MKTINPFFEENAIPVDKYYNWDELNSKPYDKLKASPYTKARAIMMNGTEFEANNFMHQFSRNCNNNDLRREIANIRRHEQQQQKILASLKPLDETILETTISYEQLAVDLTAILAKCVKDEYVQEALNFALLEDFDHLYRFSNLLEMEQGLLPTDYTREYTEIMPGRPTIAEHRHPFDSINDFLCSHTTDLQTRLVTAIITASEQQTMNYYMNVGAFYPTELGRKLFAEVAMIEEQHVTEYGSLMDTNCTWLENWLMHEYTECYMYCSCAHDETDPYIRDIYKRLYLEECGHLQKVAELLEKYQGCTWKSVFPCGGDFPPLLKFGGNIDYVREVLANTITLTKERNDYCEVNELPKSALFFKYNSTINKKPDFVASHLVIKDYIAINGKDFRYQIKKHPINELQDRTIDNTDIAH